VIHDLAYWMDLDAGTHTIDVDFYGRAISSHGVDGPYTITSLALFSANGELVDNHPLAHSTQNYSWTDFEYMGFIYLPTVLR
jgi:hypothetical protein